MENVYTEKKLKIMNKAQLLEIAAANGIDVNDGMKNDDVIALIVAKGCAIADNESLSHAPEDAGYGGDTGDIGTPTFNKEQLLKSNWYSHRRDILNSLLDGEKQYSHADVDKLIENFMKERCM